MKKTSANVQAALVREILYRRYAAGAFNEGKIFKNLTIREYFALHLIDDAIDEGSGRVYLKEISEQLGLSTSRTSSLVSGLHQRGLVKWSHDGDGTEGTYVELHDKGSALLAEQDAIIQDFSAEIIEHFGMERLHQFLALIRDFDEIIREEREVYTGRKEDGQ